MLAIQKSNDGHRKCIPNVLPCRISHNGPVNASKRYWSPTESKDRKTVSYFRGRKLHGRRVKIPEAYRGVVLSSTQQKLPQESPLPEDEIEEKEQLEDVGVLLQQAEFDEFMVWGHEVLLDAAADPYIRAVEEWISLAERIHSYPS